MPIRPFSRSPFFERELEREGTILAAERDAAEAIVTSAQAIAPRRSGAYRRGLKVVEDGQRAAAVGTDWKSHWVESGSINNPPQAPLRRGTRAAGLRLQEQ